MPLFLRVATELQNMELENLEELVLQNHLFRHFRMNKVEIASAITRPFPFLMSLRDRAFISEQMFDVSEENFLRTRNQPPTALCQVSGWEWGPLSSCPEVVGKAGITEKCCFFCSNC